MQTAVLLEILVRPRTSTLPSPAFSAPCILRIRPLLIKKTGGHLTISPLIPFYSANVQPCAAGTFITQE